MRMIQLTAVPHPDRPNRPRLNLYVAAEAIIMMTPALLAQPKLKAVDAWRQNMQILYEEVDRVVHELGMMPPNMHPDNEKEMAEMQHWAQRKDIANSLNAAYSMVQRSAADTHQKHPEIECTEVSLSCGTALEHGVMLSRVWVTETPAQIADMLAGRTDPTPFAFNTRTEPRR